MHIQLDTLMDKKFHDNSQLSIYLKIRDHHDLSNLEEGRWIVTKLTFQLKIQHWNSGYSTTQMCLKSKWKTTTPASWHLWREKVINFVRASNENTVNSEDLFCTWSITSINRTRWHWSHLNYDTKNWQKGLSLSLIFTATECNALFMLLPG